MTIQKNGPIAAVTGANGYVGSIVVNGLEAIGYQVRRLVRRPRPGSSDRYYDIAHSCSPDAITGVDVLVHCAYDLSVTSPAAIWETNVFGTRSLFDLAVSTGVQRIIFVSSMSAYPGTRQIYGRAKLASETDAFARGMCVIRPGLVYGPGWGGMAGTLKRLTTLPLIPLVGRHSYQFTVHEDDLRRAILTLATGEKVFRHPLGLAHPEPVSFEKLLRTIARAAGDRNPRFVSVPWRPVYWSIRTVEHTPAHLPIRADSLLGLVRPAPSVPNSKELEALGIEFRPFDL